jgi:hypothetical protein
MPNSILEHHAKLWLDAKQVEKNATEHRRSIEDSIKHIVDFDENTGESKTVNADKYKINISGRLDRKIDADKMEEIAAENNLTAHLPSLIRFSMSINSKAWKNTSESITLPLAAAVTCKPGRASFKITEEENENEK